MSESGVQGQRLGFMVRVGVQDQRLGLQGQRLDIQVRGWASRVKD